MAVGRPRFTLDFFSLSPPPTPRRLAGPRGGGTSAAAAASVDPSEHAGGSFFRFFPHSFAFFLSFPFVPRSHRPPRPSGPLVRATIRTRTRTACAGKHASYTWKQNGG